MKTIRVFGQFLRERLLLYRLLVLNRSFRQHTSEKSIFPLF
jgi:hypothetical protein